MWVGMFFQAIQWPDNDVQNAPLHKDLYPTTKESHSCCDNASPHLRLACSSSRAAVCRTAAEDDSPTPGKSKIVAASFLKEVETFRRKVVFFTKDADLPCLRLPAPGEKTPGFLFTTGAIKLLASQPYMQHVEMTSDGELVFAGLQTIIRVNKKGKAKKLANLADLTLTGAKAPRENLHFERLLGASATEAVLYLALSNENAEPGVSFSTSEYSYYLGKLDIPARKLLLVPYDNLLCPVVLDADTGTFYHVHAESLRIPRSQRREGA